jgi:hypothetical protein
MFFSRGAVFEWLALVRTRYKKRLLTKSIFLGFLGAIELPQGWQQLRRVVKRSYSAVVTVSTLLEYCLADIFTMVVLDELPAVPVFAFPLTKPTGLNSRGFLTILYFLTEIYK